MNRLSNPHEYKQPLQLWSSIIKFDLIKLKVKKDTLRISVRAASPLFWSSSLSSSKIPSKPTLTYQWIDINIDQLNQTPQLIDFPLPLPLPSPSGSSSTEGEYSHILIQLGHRGGDRWNFVARLFSTFQMSPRSIDRLPLNLSQIAPTHAVVWIVDTLSNSLPSTSNTDTKESLLSSSSSSATPSTIWSSDNATKIMDDINHKDSNILISYASETRHEHEWTLFVASTIRRVPLIYSNDDNLKKWTSNCQQQRCIQIWTGVSSPHNSISQAMFIFVSPAIPSIGIPSLEIEIDESRPLIQITSRQQWRPPQLRHTIVPLLSIHVPIIPLVDIVMEYTFELPDNRAPVMYIGFNHQFLAMELHRGVTITFDTFYASLQSSPSSTSLSLLGRPFPIHLRSYDNQYLMVMISNDTYYTPLPSSCRLKYLHYPPLPAIRPSSSPVMIVGPPPNDTEPLPVWIPLSSASSASTLKQSLVSVSSLSLSPINLNHNDSVVNKGHSNGDHHYHHQEDELDHDDDFFYLNVDWCNTFYVGGWCSLQLGQRCRWGSLVAKATLASISCIFRLPNDDNNDEKNGEDPKNNNKFPSSSSITSMIAERSSGHTSSMVSLSLDTKAHGAAASAANYEIAFGARRWIVYDTTPCTICHLWGDDDPRVVAFRPSRIRTPLGMDVFVTMEYGHHSDPSAAVADFTTKHVR
jgi:hypothetical protein